MKNIKSLSEFLTEAKAETNELDLTPEEITKVLAAASSTWSNIASDAAQLGVRTAKGACELVVERLVDIGRLDKKIFEKMMKAGWKAVDKFLVKNKDKWY